MYDETTSKSVCASDGCVDRFVYNSADSLCNSKSLVISHACNAYLNLQHEAYRRYEQGIRRVPTDQGNQGTFLKLFFSQGNQGKTGCCLSKSGTFSNSG